MRKPLLLLALLATSSASAEVIIVHDKPARAAVPSDSAARKLAPYSDRAKTADTWTRAWLLLDVDATGHVSRLKLVHKPGLDLDDIAVEKGFSLTFDPARDSAGNPIESYVMFALEWPSYGWMHDMVGFALRMPRLGYGPGEIAPPPCRGSGPLHMGSLHPTYRDCTPPDVSHAGELAWLHPRTATTNLR